MKIKYLAHAAFLLTAANGTRIVTDPYHKGPGLQYGEISETADILTMSHGHGDHNNKEAIRGKPEVLSGSKEIKGVKIKAVATAHDAQGGQQRGANTIFCFSADGLTVCHLGDLGHELTAAQLKELGKVDVLLIPVGGFFTIDAVTAGHVVGQVQPKVVIPMHYQTEKSQMPISGVEDFLRGKTNVMRPGMSEMELTAEKLPAAMQIIVLKPAL